MAQSTSELVADGGDGDYRPSAALYAKGTGDVEATIPTTYADRLGLKNGQPVAFYPFVKGTTISFYVDLDPSTTDRPHVRRLYRRTDEFRQTKLRFPRTHVAATGLHEHVREQSKPVLEYETRRDADGDVVGVIATPWKRLRIWAPSPDVEREPVEDVPPATKSLHVHDTYVAADLAAEHSRALDLEAGQLVSYHVTSHNGRRALVADFAEATDEDAQNTRRVQRYTAGVDGREMDQYRLNLPKALVYAFGLADAGAEFHVHPGRLVIQTPTDAEPELPLLDDLGE